MFSSSCCQAAPSIRGEAREPPARLAPRREAGISVRVTRWRVWGSLGRAGWIPVHIAHSIFGTKCRWRGLILAAMTQGWR